MRVVVTVLNVVLAVVYPLAIWWSLAHFSPRVVGLLVMALVLPAIAIRFRKAERGHLLAGLRIPLVIMSLLLLGVVFDDARFMLLLPVLINGALLATFAASLKGEMPIIERFARMQEPELSAPKQAHCRQVTVAWCVFFALNGAAAGVLALAAPLSWWAAYSGGIAYGLMGMMFVGEYVLRKYRFRDYGAGLHDRLLAKLFPAERAEGEA